MCPSTVKAHVDVRYSVVLTVNRCSLKPARFLNATPVIHKVVARRSVRNLREAQPTDVLYTPEPGQRFLQVAAEKRESAETVADVLTKAGFPAHVAAKPGDDQIFRVLVGPIKDNNDLTTKREALMKKGFRGVIPRTF